MQKRNGKNLEYIRKLLAEQTESNNVPYTWSKLSAFMGTYLCGIRPSSPPGLQTFIHYQKIITVETYRSLHHKSLRFALF